MKSCIIIPCRMESTRLPNKPLAFINDKEMICHVIDKAKKTSANEIIVTTPNVEIYNVVSNQIKCIITDSLLPSGTDRVHAAYRLNKEEFDIIVNLQGDMPNIDPQIIQDIIDVHDANCDIDICTAISNLTDDERNDPNVVKALVELTEGTHGKALMFGRYFGHLSYAFHHIGVYSFRPNALNRFVSYPESQLEKLERLEQLRALTQGMHIEAVHVMSNPLGVDTPEDLEKIRQIMKK